MVGMVIRYNRKTGDRIVREYPGPNGYANAVSDPDFRKDMGKHLGLGAGRHRFRVVRRYSYHALPVFHGT